MGAARHIRSVLAAACLAVLAMAAVPALAVERVLAVVRLSEQRLLLYVDDVVTAHWPVSTARPGYRTPVGSFRPIRLERHWRSRRYDWAPMPYSIFFRGGYAIHGTSEVRRLGRPVSHGCIRLHPEHAARLFNLVRTAGMQNSRIVVMP